ncbi:MAG TPA: cysteine desulfurase [Myxococcota bacterium]|nr:cysteine desulfurase [Myxococcota bacterium]
MRATFDVKRLREDFPILHQTLQDGHPLVYLDNAATTQKPRAVIDALERYYERDNANIHRGVHQLSQRSTAAFENARAKVQGLLGAARPSEIVFTRGTTEAINLVAQSFGRANVRSGDEVLISAMEHHSNIVPWQMLCAERGAHLRVLPINDHGELVMEELPRRLGPRTKLLAIAHVSNALGTVNPVQEIIAFAHERAVPVLIDGAQAVAHARVDVRELGCDFYCFSGHKLYGPTGIGALYGRSELLEAMAPWQGGGEMIASVTFEKTTYNVPPHKFEAGTPHIEGAIGLSAAIDYLQSVGLEAIAAYEAELLAYATRALQGLPRVRLIGTARKKASVLSFVMEGVHPHDVGTILDQEGIAIRTGHHCAQPVMDRFGVPATARASLAFYNTRDEIDALVAGLGKVAEVFV